MPELGFHLRVSGRGEFVSRCHALFQERGFFGNGLAMGNKDDGLLAVFLVKRPGPCTEEDRAGVLFAVRALEGVVGVEAGLLCEQL